MSTNAKHTPGPWRVVGGTEVRSGVAIICDTGLSQGHLPARATADAALIAAAPDLLAALRQALRHAREAMPAADRALFDREGTPDAPRIGPMWMFDAERAIAKADGRP